GFEWAGEWTVTYETFRDMGAAFVVALILIYILVVWEFGNFRIPLVIMAPIPLTLLGIIPAHWLTFQLGFGGEFTATSMIGWIALAGIIVRNSILLVDFSIHEVQKGVPVAEAVIRACKTRTRPIVITALALVAGSSVIFSDPIFQGMAISLSSGVLVSTLLTLIVIPLGCVAASKDLCEVAVASARPGTSVPCADGLVNETAGQSPAAVPQPIGPSIWARIGNVLVLVLYGIRGLFLLLFDWMKGVLKSKTPRGGPPSKPPASSRPNGGGSPPSPRGRSGSNAEEGIGASSLGTQRPNALKEASQQAADQAPAAIARSTAAPAVAEPAAEEPAPLNVASDATTAQPKTIAKKKAKAKAASKPKSAGAAPRISAAKVQKKAARRGIRLKTENGDPTSLD
ncbi:MAG: efflux RND transporter permease subunit, partial [Thiohalocapsa sp.]